MLNKGKSEAIVQNSVGDNRNSSDIKIIQLKFDERYNEDCTDDRYGCTCIAYEKCCGCIFQ